MKSINEKELEILFPQSEVVIGSTTFTIRPFSFVETKLVVDKLGNAIHHFAGDLTLETIGVIYSSAFEGIRDIIAMVLDIEPTTVERFDLGTIVKVIKEIVKVNKDFFEVSVQGNLNEMLKLLMIVQES